jgi:spoIIIJ-associated protein
MVFMADTVEAAVHLGLQELGLAEEETEVRVLRKGSRGLLGLGAREARVELLPKIRLAPVVQELASGLLERMHIPARVEATQEGLRVQVRIEGGESDGLLIGRRGETLEAFQHVLYRMAARRLDGRIRGVQVDVAGYRSRREERLKEVARGLAERARRSGRRAMTEPLSPGERRIVHRALAEEEGIETRAGGSGVNRRVLVIPTASPRRKP